MAQSEGLAASLVLPYCVYSGGGKGKSLTVVHFPCGRMLLGQAVHVGKGFFQHNYLLPPERAGEVLGILFSGIKFETAYDVTQGGVLPALDALPVEGPAPGMADVQGIPHIIHHLTQSVATGKKTYIATPPGNAHDYAAAVLAALYPHLPAPLRHMLGFCTSAREPLNKKGIHLVFTGDPPAANRGGHFFMDFVEKWGIIPSGASPRDGEDFFALRFAAMPDARFCARIFDELDFWLVREPAIAHSADLRHAVHARMARALATEDIKPEAFLRRGKSGKYEKIIGHPPEAFTVPDILRRARLTQNAPEPPDYRYLIGSYRLSPAVREGLMQTLQREERPHDLPLQRP